MTARQCIQIDRVGAEAFERLKLCVEQGLLIEALAASREMRRESPWFRNAYGVVLMRLGRLDEALGIFNELVLDPTTLNLRRDVPDVFKINLASALLLASNPRQCLKTLAVLREPGHPSSRRLRLAIRRWDGNLRCIGRILWRLGVLPSTPIPIDFVPGEL